MYAEREGLWPRYRREVREAAEYLADHAHSLDRDQLAALAIVTAWASRRTSRDIPPEPHARRVHTAALTLRRKGAVGS